MLGHPDPEIVGGEGWGWSPQKSFSVLRASFWSKNKRGPRAPSLDPLLVVKQNDVFRRLKLVSRLSTCSPGALVQWSPDGHQE